MGAAVSTAKGSVAMAYLTLSSLVQDVDDNGGILTVKMEDMKPLANNAGKFGSSNRAQLEQRLNDSGLTAMPSPLPANQYEEVRIYKTKSKVSEIIRAALSPGKQNDKKLRDAAHDVSSDKIKQIKDLIDS